MKETTEMLDLVFKLTGALSSSLEDGKFQVITDAPKFIASAMAAPKAITGANLIPAELTSATEEDRQKLITFARERFDLPDDELEILIEDSLDEMLRLFRLAKRYASYRKK